MTHQPVDAVWFWRYTKAPFRAAYGRLGSPYSKDYLQTSGDCSDVFDQKTGRTGTNRYEVTYAWPGGSRQDVVKPGGGYNPPQDLRLNFRWPYGNAPAPFRLSPLPGPVAAFPGDPSKRTVAGADRELAAFEAGDFDPWVLAVKLVGESHVLHVRAYLGKPPSERSYASITSLPQPLLTTLRSLRRGGCGTYVPGIDGLPDLFFDPALTFDAWRDPVGTPPPPPDSGLVAAAGDRPQREAIAAILERPAAVMANAVPGMTVVYVETSRSGNDPRYVGIGVIGEPVESKDSESIAFRVIGYRPLEVPLAMRDKAGNYFEPGAADAAYRAIPLRSVPLTVIERIVEESSLAPEDTAPAADAADPLTLPYPPSDYSRRIDEYAMTAAEEELKRRYAGATIRRMPKNNPGYDIRVTHAGRTIRFVEVKGTAGRRGAFFLSEGERIFSTGHPLDYSLCIVRKIDLKAGSHEISWHDGPIEHEAFALTVRQWQGRVPR